MIYGLTDSGFATKPFEQTLEEIQIEFREAFGENIDLSPESIAGAYCYNRAIKVTQLWELLGGLYSSTDINSASGIFLDRLAQLLGVVRQPATYTTVYGCLWGNANTHIPKEHQARDTNGNIFILRQRVTLDIIKCAGIKIKVSTKNVGSEFTFRIDNETFTFTATEGATKLSIRNQLITAINEKFSNFIFDTSTDDVLYFWGSTGVNSHVMQIDTPQTLELKKVGCLGMYDCATPGAVYVASGQLNEIAVNINGLDSIINYAEGETGVDAETDDRFRLSIKNRQKNASGTEVAIANAIMKLPDVEYVRLYSNREFHNVGSRPAKSYEAVVIGGNDDDIAKAIFETGPAGIQPYGNINVNVRDSEGFNWVIGFSRPVNKYIWIDVVYSINPEETQNLNIEQSLKQNLVAWSLENLTVGTDLIYQKLYTPIYKVGGIKDIELKIAVSDTLVRPSDESFVQDNIVIGQVEIALIDDSRIEVVAANAI